MSADDSNARSAEPTEAIEVRIAAAELALLDRAADRRGIERAEMVAQAIDEFLAQEAWSGGFIPPPPAMEVPRRPRLRSESGRLRWMRGSDRPGRSQEGGGTGATQSE